MPVDEGYLQEEGRANREGREDPTEVTNEYVLNVAFWSFILFMALEAVFAIIAGSGSMLEDAEAMSVDALTYLFNLCAERIKHRPFSEKELLMSGKARDYHREITRLYLELVPPLISVFTLILVTVFALKDAFETLRRDETEGLENDVDVNVMMIFSGLNLLLDVVNVLCFARAHQAFGLSDVRRESGMSNLSIRLSDSSRASFEMEDLLRDQISFHPHPLPQLSGDSEPSGLFVNLNMCSAWTVR